MHRVCARKNPVRVPWFLRQLLQTPCGQLRRHHVQRVSDEAVHCTTVGKENIHYEPVLYPVDEHSSTFSIQNRLTWTTLILFLSFYFGEMFCFIRIQEFQHENQWQSSCDV